MSKINDQKINFSPSIYFHFIGDKAIFSIKIEKNDGDLLICSLI